MEDFGVPLGGVSKITYLIDVLSPRTLSKTFSSEFGQSIAKQTKSRSVSG
jgi:hypothetical protein